MYSTSMFQSFSAEQLAVCDEDTPQPTQAYARTNEATKALTFIAVLEILKNRCFISAEFVQQILGNDLSSSAPKISLVAIEEESRLNDFYATQPGTDLCMDMSYFTDEDETPEQDMKRSRYDD